MLICQKCKLPYEWHAFLAKGHVYNTGVPRSLDEGKAIKKRVRELTRTYGRRKETSY